MIHLLIKNYYNKLFTIYNICKANNVETIFDTSYNCNIFMFLSDNHLDWCLHSFLPPKIRGGFLFLKFGQRGVS